MLKNKLPKIIFLLIIIALPFTMKAQYMSIVEQKAQLIYKIIQHLTWPNDNEMNYILIGTVNSSQEMLKQLKKNKLSRIKTGIQIEIYNFNSINDIRAIDVKGYMVFPHIIFLENNNETEIYQVFDKIEEERTVLITVDRKNSKEVMINFIIDRSGFVSFEFSFDNLAKQQIKVPERFIGLGGTNLNAEFLLDKTEKELDATKNELKAKEAENPSKRR